MTALSWFVPGVMASCGHAITWSGVRPQRRPNKLPQQELYFGFLDYGWYGVGQNPGGSANHTRQKEVLKVIAVIYYLQHLYKLS